MNDTPPAPPPRVLVGWAALVLIFAFLIFNANGKNVSDDPKARIARYQARLQAAMASYRSGEGRLQEMLTGEPATAGLRRLERDTASRRRNESIEATVWATVRRQLGEAVTAEDLGLIRKDPTSRIYAEALSAGAKPNAKALVARLESRARTSKPEELGGPVATTAADLVRRESGLPLPPKANPPAVAGLLIGALILMAGIAWTVTLLLGLSGMIQSKGPATETPTVAVADGLALRAAILMASFYVFQVVFSILGSGLDRRLGPTLTYGAMLVAVPFILRKGPSMAEVGLNGKGLARNVGIGLWVFLLEIPVTGALALVSTALLRNLPPPEHPATNALTGSNDLWTILLTFFGGVIVAPFWEETMFRGLFFPAVRRFVGPVVSALTTSFLFASIHPQGPVLWAPLACVGLFSCVLAQTTRSLVPSVTMHFAHNMTLMVLTVWIGRG